VPPHVAHSAPVPSSSLDSQALAGLVGELEDGVRAAALEMVRSIFAAELARLEAEIAASTATVPSGEPEPPTALAPEVAPTETPDVDDGLEPGAVKWWSDNKGYGFIAGDDGHDVFVHRKALVASGLRTLRDGQRVRFTKEPGTKGPVATRVRAT
jgi:cold shock CspA family protein